MIELFKQEIEQAQHIVLLGHKNPDGDATGATLALYGVLKRLNKTVNVVMPNDIPSYLRWLEGASNILTYSSKKEQVEQVMQQTDFVIALDFNSFSRIDEVGELIPEGAKCAMIDHHPNPEIDSPLLFSEPSASSTCEFLTEILYELGYDQYIDKDSATALFTGIMTDTGRFNHNSSKPKTFRMVANLLEKGVNKDEVVDKVFDSFSENRMRLVGFALNEKMEVYPEIGVAIISLSLKEKEQFNFQQGDAEGLVNMPLSIDGITRSIFMQEYEDKIRMSFRSKGDIAINTLAKEHFNGGGHRNAAGGTSYKSLESTLLKVKEALGIV